MPDTNSVSKPRSHWPRWFAFFVLICVLTLLWSVPASVLPRLLAGSHVGSVIVVEQPRGSLWSGVANRVLLTSAQQQFALENVSWRLDWRSLLAARLCLDINSRAGSDGIRFAGRSCFERNGAIQLAALDFELPAALLVSAQLRNSPLMRSLNSSVQVAGEVSGVVNDLLWHDGRMQRLDAHGVWLDAGIAMQLPDAETFRMRQQQLRLGAMPWTAQSGAADQLLLHVRSEQTAQADTDMSVDSQSEVWLDGRYITRLQLQVMPTTPQFLRDLLMIVAQPQGGDSYRLEWRNGVG